MRSSDLPWQQDLVAGVPSALLAAIPAHPDEMNYENRLQVLKALSGRDFIDRGDWFLGTWETSSTGSKTRVWELYVPELVKEAMKEPGRWDELRSLAYWKVNGSLPPFLHLPEDNGVALLRICAFDADLMRAVPWFENMGIQKLMPNLVKTLRDYIAGKVVKSDVLGYWVEDSAPSADAGQVNKQVVARAEVAHQAGNAVCRLATLEDLPGLEELERATYPADESETMDIYAERIKRFPAGCWVLTLDDKIIGHAFCEAWALFDMAMETLRQRLRLGSHLNWNAQEGDTLYFASLAVHPEYRRAAWNGSYAKWLAKNVLRHVLAEDGPFKRVSLTVGEHNRAAVKIYGDMGFSTAFSIERGFYPASPAKSALFLAAPATTLLARLSEEDAHVR